MEKAYVAAWGKLSSQSALLRREYAGVRHGPRFINPLAGKLVLCWSQGSGPFRFERLPRLSYRRKRHLPIATTPGMPLAAVCIYG